MFSTFHFAKVVLRLRPFPLEGLLSHAGWSPWQKGSGHPLLMSVRTQVHAQERASGPSCWLIWVALEQSESGPPGSFRTSFWHFSCRSMSLCALPSRRHITQSWQRALEVQYTHTYSTWTATASYLVGKRKQSVSFFLNFDPNCKKATVTRTHESPESQLRTSLQPLHRRSNTEPNKIEKRKIWLDFCWVLNLFFTVPLQWYL